MSYSGRMQSNHLYSVLLAPRGRIRMTDAGAQIAQLYLSPFDRLIGVIGESGSGKSMIIKGMFPGLELTNDDEGVNIRPLPLLNQEREGFFSPHTYHLDVRFELAFSQMYELAEAIDKTVHKGRRVIVEHFDQVYPQLGYNADLLIGVGEEIIVTRPSYFGPEPKDIADIVFNSMKYHRMAHTAEDLCEYCLAQRGVLKFRHDDVRRGFVLRLPEKIDLDLTALEQDIMDLIHQQLPVSFLDENHIKIGDMKIYCTGPRMHVANTADISSFYLHKQLLHDEVTDEYMLVGIVGEGHKVNLLDVNRINS